MCLNRTLFPKSQELHQREGQSHLDFVFCLDFVSAFDDNFESPATDGLALSALRFGPDFWAVDFEGLESVLAESVLFDSVYRKDIC